jgi:thiamine kinase-like enzyme
MIAPHDDTHTFYLKNYFGVAAESLQVSEIKKGLSGAKKYQVTLGDKDYVLRVLDPGLPPHRKQDEIAASVYAGQHYIGPQIRYVSPDGNAIIMDFVHGQTLTPELLQDLSTLNAVVKKIKALHLSSGGFPKGETVFDKITKQLEKLKQSNIPYPTTKVEASLEKLKEIASEFQNEPLVPCHNDLNCLNVLKEENGFKFVDWTGAGYGYAFNDLGFFSLVNQIGEERHKDLLIAYLDREPTQRELHLLNTIKKVSLLRIFAANFPAYEPAIDNLEERESRRQELEKMSLLPVEHFFDLETKGQLRGKEVVVPLSLSALQTFLEA